LLALLFQQARIDDRQGSLAGNRAQVMEAVEQLEDVPLIVGSGSPAVSDGLMEASQNGDFVYWEVSEPLDYYHPYSFSPRLNSYDLGMFAAQFIGDTLSAAVLDGKPLALALVYENGPRGQMTADAVRSDLSGIAIQEYPYTAPLTDAYSMAVEMRETGMNVVVVIGYESDADTLWHNLRQADANIHAWIHIGGSSYRRNTCDRLGNTDGLISISTTGEVNPAYYSGDMNVIYQRYWRTYWQQFSQTPDERADQAASGMYLLLRYILPSAQSYTPEGVREAIIRADVPAPAGFLGEGLAFPFGEGINSRASSPVWQRQNGQFCTVFPDVIATCQNSLQPFPTWRERARLEAQFPCQNQPYAPTPRGTELPRL
jgi:ABC-type branched-subunit amino acid transport system substrate-binding protein